MKNLAAQALLPALLLTAGFAAAQDGVVRSSGQPIPGASVTAVQGAQKLAIVTDEAGRYHFENLPEGDWDVTVEMFGFAPEHRQLKVGVIASVAVEWDLKLGTAKPTPPAAGLISRGPANAPPARAPGAAPVQGPRQGRGQGQTPAAGRNAGFQSVTLVSQNEGADAQAIATPEPVPVAENGGATESFLVNGSLSQGLQTPRPEDQFGGGGPGQFGGPDGFRGPGGLNGQQAGAFGGGDGAAAGGGGPGGGRGGPGGGGGFGGPGGGGPGRGGPGGIRGGGGDRGGDRRQRGPGGNPVFGNRATRGRAGIRGQAFVTVGNSALNARPFSLSGQDELKPSYGSTRMGINLGGPLNIPHLIHSDKTFFFLNYTGNLSRNPYTSFATLPTDLERIGDFSQSLTSAKLPVTVFDPVTHAPFANSQIPISRLDPTALKLLSFFPHVNQPGLVQNYQIQRSNPNNNQNINVRISRPITKKDSVDANVNYQKRDSHNTQLFGWTDELTGSGISSTVGWTHNVAKAVINNMRFTYSHNTSQTLSSFAYGPNVAASVGINGTSLNPINFGPPNLSFTNYGGLSDASPSLTRNQTAGITDGVTMVKGTHNMTFGGEFRRQQLNLRSDQNGRGSYSFSGLLTSQFDVNGQPVPNSGFDFADFLLGLPQSSNIQFGESSNYFRASVFDAYAQDDWRLRSNLTIQAGVRYEYFTPYTEKYGHLSNLDIAPGFTAVTNVTAGGTGPYSGKFPDSLINSDPNEFSPRVGIAYRPFKKKQTLIRTGYSIFFNGSVYSQFPFRLATQPPFGKSYNLVTSVVQPITVENGFTNVPTAAITNTYAVDRNYRVGYAQTWNFSIQQPFTRTFVMEIGYLGTKGTRLDVQRYPNRAPAGSFLTSQQQLAIKNASGFIFDTSDGNSISHALQVRFTRRFARGVSTNISYNYAHAIDDASTIGGGGAQVAQDDKDLRAERGRSTFDRRHTVSANYTLTSPVGENGLLRGGGMIENLLKDWTLTGSLNASTGGPLTARVLGNQANAGGTGSVGSGRADATGLPIDSGTGFFNLLAFAIPRPGTFGNAGRNTITGPAQVIMNMSFGRSFRVFNDDRKRMEFRVESNNFLNHTNITGFYTVVNASNYGLASSAGGMRNITATLRLRF